MIHNHSDNKLDKIDLKILKILQENSKITNLDLSKKIGLSPAPTLERVKNLNRQASSQATMLPLIHCH